MLGDLLVKIAKNQALTQDEKLLLRKFGSETQNRNAKVAGFTNQQGGLKVEGSFIPLFSEIFEKDTDNITIQIPKDIKHLMIVYSGKTTGASSPIIGEILSGVTYHLFSGEVSTVAGFRNTTTAELYGSTTNASLADVAGTGVIFVGTSNSFYREFLSLYTVVFTDRRTSLLVSRGDTVGVNSIFFKQLNGDFLKGTALSLYGAR